MTASDRFKPVESGWRRPKADHGHTTDPSVMCAQIMSLFLPAACRVSGTTIKLKMELRMDKECYQTHLAENITSLVLSTYSFALSRTKVIP